MEMSFLSLWNEMIANPILFMTVVLTLGVIFVNGWTDAPNAIASCVSTKCLSFRAAVWMGAVFNLLGVLVMTQINSSVAATISQMADFGTNTQSALAALCAALFSIVVYSMAASVWGIPTSESHSLIAGITGAAIAIQHGTSGIHMEEWRKVLYGLGLSLVLGFAAGWAVCRLVVFACRKLDPGKTEKFFTGAQIAGAAAMSFMHGAQDGQKFMGILLLGAAFSTGRADIAGMAVPAWMMFLCSGMMALGTCTGGKKIIQSVGEDMVRLEKYQGFSADLAGAACLLYSSLFGIPVSTTHTKTSAIMGAGAAKSLTAVNFRVVREMVLAWVLTFPVCGVISFIMAKMFMEIL